MAASADLPVIMPPFPQLRWDEFSWKGRAVLQSWRGFQCRLGNYGARSAKEESDGTVTLYVAPPGGAALKPPCAEQANAYRHLLDHETQIRDAVLQAIFDAYPAMRQRYPFGDELAAEEMPPITRPEQLRDLIGLAIVHVLNVAKDGTAYVGFEFGCTWEEEHGLGLMTHLGRIVEIAGMGGMKVGYADVSFEEWIAEEDARAEG
jgi:hypothetical protein